MSGRSFFFGFAIALAAGVPVSLGLLAITADEIPTVLGALVGAIIAVVLLVAVTVLFKDRILKRLGLTSEAVVTDAVNPAVAALKHGLAKDQDRSAEELTKVLRTLASWHVVSTARRWMMATVIGLLAAFAAMLGSALIVRQNALILEQNRTLTEQVRLALAQVHTSTVLDVAKTARELILRAWDVPELRPLVDSSAANTDPKRLDGFVKVLIQHHVTVYLNSRLGNLPAEFQKNVERDTESFFCMPAVRKVWKGVENTYSDEVKKIADRCK